MFTQAAAYFASAEAQYQLGVMWLDGAAGGVDPIRAARWLNLAAEKGHGNAQAVLGRMLFMGEAMPRQAWRGLMWLQLARDNARGQSTGWVREMHDKAFAAASDEERRMARQHAERFLRAASGAERLRSGCRHHQIVRELERHGQRRRRARQRRARLRIPARFIAVTMRLKS